MENQDRLFNVLFIEDDSSYAAILTKRLLQMKQPSFHVDTAKDLREGLAALAAQKTDVVLLDLSLPDSQGLESLMRLRSHAPEVPVVISTGIDDDRTGVEALRRGADDYLVKGRVASDVIGRILRYAIERQRLREAVQSLTITDELTGLYNRRGFLTLAEQQQKIAQRARAGFSIFFIDLDNFKRLNDERGHAAGDRALNNFARILKNTFRGSDLLARLGGDEFAVLSMTEQSLADHVLTRLRRNVARYNRQSAEPLAFSAGVEHFHPDAQCFIEEMLARADKKMYDEKRQKQTPGAPDYGNESHGDTAAADR